MQAVKALDLTVSSPKCSFKGDIITLFDPPHQIYSKYAKKHDVEIKVKTNSLEYDGNASLNHIDEVYSGDKQAGLFR